MREEEGNDYETQRIFLDKGEYLIRHFRFIDFPNFEYHVTRKIWMWRSIQKIRARYSDHISSWLHLSILRLSRENDVLV